MARTTGCAVHNVYMDIVGTGGHKRADVAFKVGKISGKDGRGYFRHNGASCTKKVKRCTTRGGGAYG